MCNGYSFKGNYEDISALYAIFDSMYALELQDTLMHIILTEECTSTKCIDIAIEHIKDVETQNEIKEPINIEIDRYLFGPEDIEWHKELDKKFLEYKNNTVLDAISAMRFYREQTEDCRNILISNYFEWPL